MLGIRSRTQLTPTVLRGRRRLMAIGCFCIGTNQVDLDGGARGGDPGVQRALLQHPQRRRAGDGRDHHADARDLPQVACRPSRRLDQVGRRTARGARQDAGHRRLRQYRQPARRHRRGAGHARASTTTAPTSCRTAMPRPAATLGRAAGPGRRGHPARARDAGHRRHDRRGADPGDEAGRVPDQHLARHASSTSRRWPRRSATAICAAPPSTCSPTSRPATREEFAQPAARPAQRHPDAAYRRLDRGSAGAHRRRGRAQADRLFRQRLDHRRGELPAGAAAGRGRRRRASSTCTATCPACCAG